MRTSPEQAAGQRNGRGFDACRGATASRSQITFGTRVPESDDSGTAARRGHRHLRPRASGSAIARAKRDEVIMTVLKDVRFAVRSLKKHPVFAAATIATLGLGVGATLAVFTVVNGVLLRPLPYKDPSRIAMIWIANTNAEGRTLDLPLSSGFFADIE